jgi:DNA-binding MarR family transcriptional regulator
VASKVRRASAPTAASASDAPPGVEAGIDLVDGRIDPDGTIDDELAARLRVAVMRLHRRLRQESLGDVSPAQASALATIDRRGRPTLGELAQAEQVQPPSLTPLVGAMESAGLVVRLPDPLDRRICRVELTTEGRRALERIRMAKNAYLAQRLESFHGAERDRARDLTELLEDLVRE